MATIYYFNGDDANLSNVDNWYSDLSFTSLGRLTTGDDAIVSADAEAGTLNCDSCYVWRILGK